MVKLPEEAKSLLETAAKNSQVTVATSSKDCTPNAVPVEWAKLYDDEHILVADNFFQKTRRNIDENPKVSITFWSSKPKDGYQVKGTSRIFTSGKEYEEAVNWVKSQYPKLKTKAALLVKVEEIYSVKPGSDAGKKLA